jgi:hypothetical protein
MTLIARLNTKGLVAYMGTSNRHVIIAGKFQSIELRSEWCNFVQPIQAALVHANQLEMKWNAQITSIKHKTQVNENKQWCKIILGYVTSEQHKMLKLNGKNSQQVVLRRNRKINAIAVCDDFSSTIVADK